MPRPLSTSIQACVSTVLALSLLGCATAPSRTWQYPPDPPGTLLGITAPTQVQARVTVLPLRDERGTKNDCSSYWLIALPLIPYTKNSFERPEQLENPEYVDTVVFDPPRDMAQAIAAELDHAGIFSSVSYQAGNGAADADLILSGTLTSTKWSRRATTYMFGGVGTVFWFLGAPLGDNTTALQLTLKLAPARDPSKTLWSFRMTFNDQHLEGPYYGLAESVQNYPLALQRGLEVAVTDLARLAQERPEVFSGAPTLAQLGTRP